MNVRVAFITVALHLQARISRGRVEDGCHFRSFLVGFWLVKSGGSATITMRWPCLARFLSFLSHQCHQCRDDWSGRGAQHVLIPPPCSSCSMCSKHHSEQWVRPRWTLVAVSLIINVAAPSHRVTSHKISNTSLFIPAETHPLSGGAPWRGTSCFRPLRMYNVSYDDRAIETVLVWRYSWTAASPFSRPMPDCLKPPKGSWGEAPP